MKFLEKQKAIKLRKQGYSLNEISYQLNVAKSMASLWARDIKLSKKAIKRLSTKITQGQHKSAEIKKIKTRELLEIFNNNAFDLVDPNLNKETLKICCALLYWCEGAKTCDTFVHFTNSDIKLIRTFVYLLRQSFNLDERKFRACIHLHSYHNSDRQIRLWSKITKISEKQFTKPYRKANSGKIIRPGYPGCIQIKYYDVNISRELLAIAKIFSQKYGGVG